MCQRLMVRRMTGVMVDCSAVVEKKKSVHTIWRKINGMTRTIFTRWKAAEYSQDPKYPRGRFGQMIET